jgi:hypothetical protein
MYLLGTSIRVGGKVVPRAILPSEGKDRESEEIEEAKVTRKKPQPQYVCFLLSVSCEAFLVK